MLSKVNALEVVGDSRGNALVRYHDRILMTELQAADLAQALADFQSSGKTSIEVEKLLALTSSFRELDDRNSTCQLEESVDIGSIVQCVVGQKEPILILWRGSAAEQLARGMSHSLISSRVSYLPTASANVIDSMMKRYRESSGFPRTPLWFNDNLALNSGLADLNELVRGMRAIVLIAESIAFWEIDNLLATTAPQGTPVLPITFSGACAQIGPLILGGNASAFYLSRLGHIGYRSADIAAVQLLSSSQTFNGAGDVVTREALNIIQNLPDSSCISVAEVTPEEQVSRRAIRPLSYIQDKKLEGALWSITALLDPSIAFDDLSWDRAAQHLQNGGLVSIESAFRKEVADIMHTSLESSSKWDVHEGIHPYFWFHHHNIYEMEDMSPAMVIASMIFSSCPTTNWASKLIGSDCNGAVQQSASWYMPGDHSTPHSDATAQRKLAFVWHLAYAWDAAWGGHLVWVGGDKIIPATFNSLHLFDTRRSGRHFVMQVAPNARGKRLCWNGWWTSRQDVDQSVPDEPVDFPENKSGFRFHHRLPVTSSF